MENTSVSQDKLISFIYLPEEDRADLLSVEEAKEIGDALYRVKIVDPACGSGAFLVGMLHVLVELYRQILKKLNRSLNLFEVKKEIINHNLYGVDIKDSAPSVMRPIILNSKLIFCIFMLILFSNCKSTA